MNMSFITTKTACSVTQVLKNTRNFWQWINIIFNKVDEDRRKLLGPDRTCAEWLLRNGAAVKFVGFPEYLNDYNGLPLEGVPLHIKEIDATDSSIMHQGFPHFIGCKYIEKIIFDKCSYLENEGLHQLTPLEKTLKYLQVSRCGNITDKGLEGLHSLRNLGILLLYDLPYVKNKSAVVDSLKQKLPQCNITFE